MSGPADTTRAALARRLAELSPAKRALLERGAAPLAAPAHPDASIPRRAPGSPAPMSYAQELVWLLEQVNPGHVYNVPRVVRLQGPLDVTALQRALDALVARHESLRTTLETVGESPCQIVHPPAPLRIEQSDVSGSDNDASLARAREIVRAFAQRPFDLARDWPLRAALVRIAADDHVLVLGSHHTASDGWSRTIMLRELAELYRAELAGEAAMLPALPIQYADFAAWQRDRMASGEGERLERYWMSQLDGAPPLLELPTDRARTNAPSFAGDTVAMEFPLALLDALRRVSTENGVTLYMTLLAAFDALLARYTNQDDILVGSPIVARPHLDTHGVVGYFTNTLLLRTRVDLAMPFRGLLQHVRDVCLGAYEHQELPFERIMLQLQRERAGAGPRLQVLFSLQDPEHQPFALEGTRAVPFGRQSGASKVELSLTLLEQSTGLRVLAEFRTDLFDAATVERLVGHYRTLLESVVADVSAPVGRLPMVSEPERVRLAREWAGARRDWGSLRTVPEQISHWALTTPDATAVSCADGVLSYAELDARAASLAATLVQRGARPGRLVAVCLPRSPELVIALVAVLYAGAAYVPLDPEHPIDRLTTVLGEAAPDVVITTSALLGSLGASTQAVCIDDAAKSEQRRHPDVHGRATMDDLAYVIYTSGSTGRPKGVCVSHGAVANYLAWMREAYSVRPADAVLQKAPATFDASVWELFLPLVAGARLVLAPTTAPQDPSVLLAAVREHGVSLLQLVPSQLRMVLESGSGAELAGVRRLFLGGEALPREVLAQLVATCPQLPITNLYGPTEATVYATYWDVEPGTWAPSQPVMIGTPIANARVYLLDDAGSLVPDGAVGEIVIGGAGVADGYLNRPELTAERFIPDPFGRAGERAYRTGDRGRRRVSGGIEFLGRADGQVKLRGFRIELGEIESVLTTCPGVTGAIAALEEHADGDRRLLAYVTIAAGVQLGTAELRQFVRQRLPDFMVPSTVAVMSAFPVTPNGKLDRNALRAHGVTQPQGEAGATAIAGPVEQVVAELWQEILQTERVGAETNFFDVGGHSLLAMRMAARLSRLLRRRVTLGLVFQHPTVRDFASALAADDPRPGHTGAVCRALLALRDMTPEERERRRAAAATQMPARSNATETV